MSRLNGQVALVTGGATGLGKAIAQRFADDGANVVITDVQQSIGQATAAQCGFIFLEQDVRDEQRWPQVVEQIQQRLGPLKILVNNAGILGPVDATSPENTRLADWKGIFAVNVEAVFLGCRTAIAAMRGTGGGSIVNIASIAAMQATPYGTAYGASKAAVRQLTRSVAQHCAQERLNIRCNSVHPGVVRTELWDSHAEHVARTRGVPVDEVVAQGRATIPLGAFVSPEDVAAVVAFLVSADARHVTGAEFIVDGGVTGCDTYEANSNNASP